MKYLCLVIFMSIFTLKAYSQDRKIKMTINPGCASLCENNSLSLIHVQAESKDDVLHHIWDFTGKPSIFSALTTKNTTLNIDWDNFLWEGKEGSVTFSEDPLSYFSTIFDKIFMFNDVNNTGVFDENNTDSSYVATIDPAGLNWTLSSIDTNARTASAVFEGKNIADVSLSSGSVKIMLSTFGTKDRGSLAPHLFHTSNVTQAEIWLERLPVTQLGPRSRPALSLVLLSSDPSTSSVVALTRTSIDDEHSPGIFQVNEVITPSGYIEWRKVAYTWHERSMANSTEVHGGNKVVMAGLEHLTLSFAYAVYGARLTSYLSPAINITFGAKNDGFYASTNFISWTMLSGLGHPAAEELSSLVLILLCLGLGMPVLLLLMAAVCFIYRRITKSTDDLILTQ